MGEGVPFSDSEACLDGVCGPPGHCHAVHHGFGPIVEGGPVRLLQAVLLKHQGQKKAKLGFLSVLVSLVRLHPRASQSADQQNREALDRKFEQLKEWVRNCAGMSMEEAREELEEQEKQKRLGAGGLDPIEVYKSFPKHMQRSFDEKNIEMLHEAIGNMHPDDDDDDDEEDEVVVSTGGQVSPGKVHRL
ncbi:hsp90 co-chaperone Cdc37-like [Hippocampus zosterae]|uniref:hsp90 co-chaperone Cdc37-like n=1 Tax=Hippocampus zosterae TaxID=109293 RepID=UPI00223D83E6|nr:hsp90 co-chaperone Cdc37-like [Hippocampus zosterae]